MVVGRLNFYIVILNDFKNIGLYVKDATNVLNNAMNNSQFNINSESDFFDYHKDFIANKLKSTNGKNRKEKPISIPGATYFTLCQNHYSVQFIKGKRFVRGKVQYLIGWESFPGQDTWEYIENLQHVQQMVIEYEKKIKLNEIQKERQRFGITRSYDYDFSSRGRTLIHINQAENKILKSTSALKPVHQQSMSTNPSSKQIQSSSYVLSYVSSLQSASKEHSFQNNSSASNWSLDLAQLEQEIQNIAPKIHARPTLSTIVAQIKSNSYVVSSHEYANEQHEDTMEIQEQAPAQNQVIIRPYKKRNTAASNQLS